MLAGRQSLDMRILVIEDEPDLLRSLAQALREAGYAVDTASEGEEGLYKAETAATIGTLTAVANAGIEDPREMNEVTATEDKMKPIADATGAGVFWTRTPGLLASATGTSVEVPRVTLLSNAKLLAGSGWMGLKDRDAHLTRGVKLTPMFTGFAALSALLFLLAIAWWREGR